MHPSLSFIVAFLLHPVAERLDGHSRNCCLGRAAGRDGARCGECPWKRAGGRHGCGCSLTRRVHSIDAAPLRITLRSKLASCLLYGGREWDDIYICSRFSLAKPDQILVVIPIAGWRPFGRAATSLSFLTLTHSPSTHSLALEASCNPNTDIMSILLAFPVWPLRRLGAVRDKK